MNKKVIYLLCFFYACMPLLRAQTQERIELKVEEARSTYTVLPIGNQGVIIGYEPVSEERGIKEFRCIKYGTDFKEQKTINISMLPKYTIVAHETEGNFIYMLFSYNSIQFKDYTLVRLNTDNMTYTNYNGSFQNYLHFKTLTVTNGFAYLGGQAGPRDGVVRTIYSLSIFCCFIPLIFYHPHYFPYVAAIDMSKKTGNKKDFIMNEFEKGTAAIIDMTTEDSVNTCNLLMIHKTKKVSKVFLKEITNLKAGKEISFKFPDNKEPNRGKINVVDNKQKLIAGTYGLSNKYSSRNPIANGAETRAQGIYFASMVDNKQQFINLLPFTTFKKFKLASDKVITKTKKKEKEDKLLLQLNVNFHDFLIREEETLLFGEVYFPVFHYETYTTYDSKGIAHTTTRKVFDGYQWKGAMIIAFDKAGKMTWENGFEISNSPLSFNTNYKFRFIEQEDGGIKIVYCDKSAIQSKIIYNGTESEKLKDVKVVSAKKSSKVIQQTSTDQNGVEYWYDKNYLAYGFQKTKKDKKEKGKKYKNIFYMNKITLDE